MIYFLVDVLTYYMCLLYRKL